MQSIDNIKKMALPELSDFVNEFVESRRAEVSQLDDLIAAEKWEEISKFAHNWKGYCKPYGMIELGELGALLEISIKDKSFEAARDLIKKIKQYLESISA